MSDKKKEQEFVVTDRRKFTEEGELRPERAGDVNEQDVAGKDLAQKPVAEPALTQPAASVVSEGISAAQLKEEVEASQKPPLPTEADQHAQRQDYTAGSKKLDELLREKTGRGPQEFEMTFERLVASLYMSAMVQLGLMAPEGEQPRADILGARQTIDTLALLNDKTKGNLTETEQNLLQQSLFDLRMAFIDLTNAITRTPPPSAMPPGGKK